MLTELQYKRIGEYTTLQGGFAYKSKDFSDTGVPVLKIRNIRHRDIDITETDKVSESIAQETQRYFVKPKDILISMTGSGIQAPDSIVGRVAWYTGEEEKYLINQRVGRFLINRPDVLEARYLYYFLSQRAIQWELVSIATGSANQVNISAGQIQDLNFPYRDVTEQKAIAHILGSLDDKIENNRKMNETLEAMARAIFKSWFVDFGPVRQKMDGKKPYGMDDATAALFPDSFEDSPLGKIPKGWDVMPMSEAIDINPKRTLKKGTYSIYVDMKAMPTSGHQPYGWIYREFTSGTKFINGDTLLARITPCLENGKTAYIDFLLDDEVAWGSTEYIVLSPKSPLPSEYGYFLARDEELRGHAIQNMTGSSGRQRVQMDCFDSYNLVIPHKDTLNTFSEVVSPMMSKMKSNNEESLTLSEIRDTLLPKLISGQIRIKDAEKFMEEIS